MQNTKQVPDLIVPSSITTICAKTDSPHLVLVDAKWLNEVIENLNQTADVYERMWLQAEETVQNNCVAVRLLSANLIHAAAQNRYLSEALTL